jgi:hypothetical protein
MPTRIFVMGIPDVVVESELQEVTAELAMMGIPFATFRLAGDDDGRQVLIRRDAIVRLEEVPA